MTLNSRAAARRAAALALAAALPCLGWAAASRPNVVIFLTDDQGWGDIGCHGNPRAATPHMDAFAAGAVELARFHVSPVCSPTRASLMTGRYNFRTGVADVFGDATRMDPGEVTIAEALRTAGYATGIFGKWHLGDQPPHDPRSQGFDESLVHAGPAMKTYFDPVLFDNGERKTLPGYCLDIFAGRAIEFIRRNREKPFFLYLASNLVHTPLQVEEDRVAPFAAAGLDEKTAKICAMLGRVDGNFGRVLAALKELGLEDNTLVIFFSDNGPCSGSITPQRFMAGHHGLKGTPYENGIHVPCFMRWPAGFKAPARVERNAAHIDIMPTVLDACGVPKPTAVAWDGASLMPLLRDPSCAWPDRSLFFQWDSGQAPRRGHAFAVLGPKYKLVQPCGMDAPNQKHIRDRYAELCAAQGRGVRSIEGPPRFELYDIAADPGETRDIAATHGDVVADMKRQYEAWFDSAAARWLKATAPAP